MPVGHNDAGEDWTEDNRVRQPAWLQVAVEQQLHGQRLPLLPVATVLGDVLHHMGTYTLTVTISRDGDHPKPNA
jgi:hypothetical protein